MLRYRLNDIRRRIKADSKKVLTETLMPAVRLCLLLTAIYLIVFYIKLYASPVLEVEGEGIPALINAYIQMEWRELLSIFVINIFSILVIGPAMCSFAEFFIKTTDRTKEGMAVESSRSIGTASFNEEDELKTSKFLYWFSKASCTKKAILLRLSVSLLSVFWHVVYIGPPLVLIYFLKGNPNSLSYTNKLFIYTTWILVGYLLTYIKLGVYYPAHYLVAKHPDMSVVEALKDSSNMMRGHAMEFFWYKLSFIPWYALCVVTFGIGLVYVVPYRGTCDAMFVRYIDSVSSGGNLPW